MAIYYKTQGEVSPAAQAEILADLASLVYPIGQPWAEAIDLFAGDDQILQGSNNILRNVAHSETGSREGIDEADDMLMAGIDLDSTLAWLRRMGKRHDLIWLLTLDGLELGMVDATAISDDLAAFPTELVTTSGAPDLAHAIQRAPALCRKYSIRYGIT